MLRLLNAQLSASPYDDAPAATSESQTEVDHYWERLLDGGRPDRRGWLKDRYGVPWQIVPEGLSDLIGGSDPDGAARAMQAMLGMIKLDIAELQRAYDGA